MRNSSWLIIVILSLFSYSATLAQQNPITNLVDQPKWEIGTDLLWLIDKNTLPKYSLLVRRKIGQHGAIRLRGGYTKKSVQPHFPNENEDNQYSLIRIGYEYQKNLSLKNGSVKSLVYGGLDLFSRYQFDSFQLENTITNPGQVLVVRVNETTNDKGGAAFIGFKYFLTTYISLSAESSFQLSSLQFSSRGSAPGFNSGIDYTVGTYQFLPLNTINFSFHF